MGPSIEEDLDEGVLRRPADRSRPLWWAVLAAPVVLVVAVAAAREPVQSTPVAATGPPAPAAAPADTTSTPTTPPTTTPPLPTTTTPSPAAPPTTARRSAEVPRTTTTPIPRAPAAAPRTDPRGSPTSYSFWSVDDAGRPARWDPCTPIRWAVNLDSAPPGALDLATTAVARLSAAAGLQTTYAGQTSFKPLRTPEQAFPAGIDAVIAFAAPGEYSEFEGSTFGLGGFTSMATSQGPRIVHGGVVLDGAKAATIPDGFLRGQHRGPALLHELGHLAGLGHVADPTQLMDEELTPSSPPDYAAGDTSGLRALGAGGGCFSGPAPVVPGG